MKAVDVAAVLNEMGIRTFEDEGNPDYVVGIKHHGDIAERSLEAMNADGPWQLIRWDNKFIDERAHTPEGIKELIERSMAMGGLTQNQLDGELPDVFDLPDPREIISGKMTEMANNDASLCYATMSAIVSLLCERAKDLAVPRTSDEANQIWVREVETSFTFMNSNFPIELVVLAVRDLKTRVEFPSSDIAPHPVFDAAIVTSGHFYSI